MNHRRLWGATPAKVTIAGQSRGVQSVQTIVSSPLSQGLLRGAILQSGRRAVRHETLPHERGGPRHLPEAHGVSERVHCGGAAHGGPRNSCGTRPTAVQGPDLSWRPHVDGWLLPAHVDAQAEAGAIHDISYMIGSTAKDIGQGRQLQEAGAVGARTCWTWAGSRGTSTTLPAACPGTTRGVPLLRAVVRV